MFPERFIPYSEQQKKLPKRGNNILSYYDENSIIVYQAFNKDIRNFAVKNQVFGGDFSYNRMSWIKPGFMWMMNRTGWRTKPNREMILAISLPGKFF